MSKKINKVASRSLYSLINDKEVDLSHACLKALPQVFVRLTKVKVVNLRQNLLSDVSQLLHLETLIDLDLYDNEITAMPDLSNLCKLEYVMI